MKWTDLILALMAGLSPLTAIVGGIIYYRQNKTKKELEIVHEVKRIEIDETTRNNLVLEAANINQAREERREEWWGRQIAVLRTEMEAERALSNKRFRRLNQLEVWATQHVVWDRKAWNKLLETDPGFQPPPALPDEIDNITVPPADD